MAIHLHDSTILYAIGTNILKIGIVKIIIWKKKIYWKISQSIYCALKDVFKVAFIKSDLL